jgi:Uma2 family endonuclease
MGMPATERSWTRAEVLDLIARNPLITPRYELVDGVLLVTPAPTNRHQIAVARMLVLLTNYLETERGVGYALASPADVMPEPGTTVGPDVFVAAAGELRRVPDKGPIENLLLVVEVRSPRDRGGDRGRKRQLYHRSVPEYWIIDTAQRHIERWRRGVDEPDIVRDRLEWHPVRAAAPLVLDVAAYFADVYLER